ncbi:MAG: hypothetical protein ABI051_02065 [Vicinamibacterales bacterium]
MASNGLDEPSGRETRLLVLVVAVAFAVLLLLARFRFPGSDLSAVSSSAAPLSGLAARATFDDMAETLGNVLARVSPMVVVVQLEPATAGEPAARAARGRRAGGAGAVTPAGAGATPSSNAAMRLVPALRVRPNLALVYLPAGMRPVSVPGLDLPIELVAADAEHSMALIRTGGLPGADGMATPLRTFGGFAYVALIDATPTGPTAQPIFIGRADPVIERHWPQALTALGANSNIPAGSLLFSMAGRFIGMVTTSDLGNAIVPVPAIEALVTQMAGGARGAEQ